MAGFLPLAVIAKMKVAATQRRLTVDEVCDSEKRDTWG